MEAGSELIEAMGDFGQTFVNEDDQLGMSGAFTMDALDSFVARYGG